LSFESKPPFEKRTKKKRKRKRRKNHEKFEVPEK
jgi:hypothetical protein